MRGCLGTFCCVWWSRGLEKAPNTKNVPVWIHFLCSVQASTLLCPHIPDGIHMEWFCSINSTWIPYTPTMDSIHFHMDSMHFQMDSIQFQMDSMHFQMDSMHFPGGFHALSRWIPCNSMWIPCTSKVDST